MKVVVKKNDDDVLFQKVTQAYSEDICPMNLV